jgi:CrcB protein
MNLTAFIMVGFGGALGAMARFALSHLLGLYAILAVNILGCFLMGALVGFLTLKTSINQTIILFLSIGVLGGFTTFSNFALETLSMVDTQKYIIAGVYILASVGGGLTAFILGRFLVKTIL